MRPTKVQRALIDRLESRLLLAAGDLDRGFGGDGVVRGPEGSAIDVEIQADNKVVVLASDPSGAGRSRLIRYNANGTLDPSFGGGDGVAPVIEHAQDVLLLANGRILVAGGALNDVQSTTFSVARYRPDGGLERAFGGGDGVARLFDADSLAKDLALTAGGKIVAAGVGTPPGESFSQFAVVRLNPDGSFDNSFSGDGVAYATFDGTHRTVANSVVVRPDGKVVAGGVIEFIGEIHGQAYTIPYLAMARFNSDGSPDTSLNPGDPPGTGGRFYRTDYFGPDDMELQSDGRLVIVYGSFVYRFNANGTPDRTFADNGVIEFNGGNGPFVSDIEIGPDGKLLLAGHSTDTEHSTDSAVVLRYLADGTPDPSFGEGGAVTVQYGVTSGNRGVAVRNGKVVAAGQSMDSLMGPAHVGVSRLHYGGAVGGGGKGTGLLGTYYDNEDFTGQKFQRVDGTIDFQWGRGSPDGRIGPDTFSVRWSGQILAPQTGRYVFSARADDRARLIIDGKTVVNFIPGKTPHRGSIHLTAGKHSIVYRYVERTGNARASLSWDTPSGPMQVVPRQNLFADEPKARARVIEGV